MSTTSTPTILKNGSNFTEWQHSIRSILMAKQLWGFIDKTKLQPTDIAPNNNNTQLILQNQEKQQDFNQCKISALGFIGMSINSSLQEVMASITNPLAAYNAICNHYQPNQINQHTQLYCALY